jgi:hypothetical protein
MICPLLDSRQIRVLPRTLQVRLNVARIMHSRLTTRMSLQVPLDPNDIPTQRRVLNALATTDI